MIADHLAKAGIERPQRVLEFGCNFGDLLAYYARQGALECYGVEASAAAKNFGNSLYQGAISIHHGTVADNPVCEDLGNEGRFDLVIIDDVFGWISRETLFQSISNIDKMVADDGVIFIRDFLPNKRVRNRNHHIKDSDVFNYKVPGSHASIFLASGVYETEFQVSFFDGLGISTSYKCDNPFNYRWTDVVLKSLTRNFLTKVLNSNGLSK